MDIEKSPISLGGNDYCPNEQMCSMPAKNLSCHMMLNMYNNTVTFATLDLPPQLREPT